MSDLEYCSECDQPTGRAGRFEDSIFIEYEDGKPEVGPLCSDCRDRHWVCGECGLGVHPRDVTYEETHAGCGGVCS